MNEPNSPAGALLKMRLASIQYLARDTLAYAFESLDGSPLPAAEPGAHIGLHLPNGLVRQYSLLEGNANPRSYQVGVKRDAKSRGGSRFMHEELRCGTVLSVEAPRNNFPLHEDAAHTVLIGGGIGITPVLCMARRLKSLGRSASLYYSCRERVDVAFADELARYDNVPVHVDAEVGGVLNMAKIVAEHPAGAHFYCCGPGPMLAAFEEATASLPREQVHVEYFTAKQEAALDGGYTVELRRSNKTLSVPPGQTILQVVRDAGVDVPYSCEQGVCGACETRVIEGRPDHRDAILSDPEKAANETMIICCSGCKGDRLVLDL
ncbi:PDR/VanB family oxidoreductase [Pandoraea oxalativorans]|uniref:Ferredoxin n=1 Tax=Pandoraea oxalativorans TaxID=573737 RepID=A0A0E3U9I6_9BURK|nr:PDR/VanB family oxidoreductase [Pandoraea oxalativorans]AKC72228.1 ferredoxin [Pandoraea oxalativorans]